MTHTYYISGMTCGNCVAKVKSELLKMGDITETTVQLKSPQAIISMQKHIPLASLQSALQKAGSFSITEADGGMHAHTNDAAQGSWWVTYKPIWLIFLYILLVTGVVTWPPDRFDWMRAMQVFMSGFFLVFSFFKMLDLKGFADSYAMYDIIARRFKAWGFIYAFIELALGIAYAVHFQPVITSAVTLVVMTVSIIGVLQSVLNKQKIQCACLGAVFNLPMSTVTITEDALMIAMSGIMLATIL